MNNTVTRQVLGKVAMTSRGEYDTSKSYEILDIVTYQGSSYLSKKYNNDSLPTNANDWQLLAQKGDTYELSEEDLQRIAEQITNNANSAFNQNVKEKTDGFNSNANSKTEAYNTNATEKLDTYNSNHTAKLKEYNDNASSKLSAYNANTVAKTTEYNSNHTNKLSAYNTNAETRLEEYNTNADNKIAEYDEHSKELNNKIVSTRNELERLKSNVLNTGEDTDTFIHLEDSAMAELQEIKVDGVCEQETTTGKNLLSIPDITNTNGGITFNLSDNNVLSFSGTATSSYINVSSKIDNPMKSGETYTFSIDKATNVRIVLYETTPQVARIIPVDSTSVTFTASSASKVFIGIIGLTSGNSYSGTIKMQIEKGSTATSYEPYTGGQPSPNPNYPQEIKTITDSLKVTSCGKNLFDINKTTYPRTAGGLTITAENGYFIINGTCTSTYANITSIMNFIIGAGTYTISIDAPQNFNITLKRIFPDGSLSDIVLPANSLTKTFTTGRISNRYYFFIGGLTPGMTIDNAKFKIQFERKDNATSIEDYIESQIQAKLPENEFIGKLDDTYKDTLRAEYNKDDGQYHLMLDKMIGHKNFNNETTILYSELQGDYFLFQIIIGYLPSAVMISNNFINKSNYGLSYNYESIYRGGSGNRAFQFKVKKERVASYDNDGALSFIKNSNTEVYYVLAKPYTVDLGAIDMPMSYKDITNIFTDSDLLPTITAKYYRVFDKTIQNAQINEKTLKQEITDLNATVSALDTRLKALETKSVEEPTESEGTV